MFTTEGHIVSVDERFRSSLWEDILPGEEDSAQKTKPTELKAANFSSNVRKAPAAPACGVGKGQAGQTEPFGSVSKEGGECFL